MAANRVFFPQDALELWMADGRADVDGDLMTLDGVAFELTTGVCILTEVTGEPDEGDLVGKCKTLDQILALGGEHCSDSVILNDNAYEAVEGFLAELASPPPGDGTPEALAALFAEE